MGKRYLCEFCDKSFADNPANRRNHLRGVQHKQIRKQHYDAFRDPETILAEESQKRPCRKYMQSGFCEFGATCRYSHMSPTHRQELEQLIKLKEQKKREKGSSKAISLDDWLLKRSSKSNTTLTRSDSAGPADHEPLKLPAYSIPETLHHFTNLPPSMVPPPPNVLQEFYPPEWG